MWSIIHLLDWTGLMQKILFNFLKGLPTSSFLKLVMRICQLKTVLHELSWKSTSKWEGVPSFSRTILCSITKISAYKLQRYGNVATSLVDTPFELRSFKLRAFKLRTFALWRNIANSNAQAHTQDTTTLRERRCRKYCMSRNKRPLRQLSMHVVGWMVMGVVERLKQTPENEISISTFLNRVWLRLGIMLNPDCLIWSPAHLTMRPLGRTLYKKKNAKLNEPL